jgi:hypothetical protein
MKQVIVYNALTGVQKKFIVHDKWLHQYVQTALRDLDVPIQHQTVYCAQTSRAGYRQTNLKMGNLTVACVFVSI